MPDKHRLRTEFYSHMFRANFATHLNHAGVNLTGIQELMGYSEIKTTARYVGGEDIRAVIETLKRG